MGTVVRWVMRVWDRLVTLFSFEWLLTRCRFPNGGAVILLRALAIAVEVTLFTTFAIEVLDPCDVSLGDLRRKLLDRTPWFGATLTVVYAALYTRFASQWAYLAGVYNQIKAAECRGDCDAIKLAEWKAGFIVDADELHLARKRLFRSVINAWRKEEAVEKAYKAASDPPPPMPTS